LAPGGALGGPAIGQFEIKTLSAEPGEIEFQSQNAFAFGVPKRRTMPNGAGGLDADDNSIARERYGLEVEIGIATFFKMRAGIEYEKERLEELILPSEADAFGDLKLDEYALEGVGILIPRRSHGFALGFVVEYEHPAEAGGSRTLAGGPIVEWASGPWRVTLNPTLVQFYGGERNEVGRRDEKLDLGYAVRLIYAWSERLSLAVEGYGTVERIGGSGERSEEAQLFGDFDQHRAGPIVYWTLPQIAAWKTEGGSSWSADEVTLGVGTLFGLNGETPDVTLKVSLEAMF
jgi:hypothetical protein